MKRMSVRCVSMTPPYLAMTRAVSMKLMSARRVSMTPRHVSMILESVLSDRGGVSTGTCSASPEPGLGTQYLSEEGSCVRFTNFVSHNFRLESNK